MEGGRFSKTWGSHGRLALLICLKRLPPASLPLFLVPQPYNIYGKDTDGNWEELWQCPKPQLNAFDGRLCNQVVLPNWEM